MSTNETLSGGTIVYVDGYNLYYGRLRDTPFKWLDLVQLSLGILNHRDQNEKLQKVKLFTAPALATFATHGNASVEAQSAYHRALQAVHGSRFEVINGTHTFDRDGALLPTFISGKPYDRSVGTRVWKIEEKKTDVNLAISMYRDACRQLVDQIILISNDSDAEPALVAIREDFPDIRIGVVMPIKPLLPGGNIHRRPSGSLSKHADWTGDQSPLPHHRLALKLYIVNCAPKEKPPTPREYRHRSIVCWWLGFERPMEVFRSRGVVTITHRGILHLRCAWNWI